MSSQQEIGVYDHSLNKAVFNQITPSSTCLDVGCWIGNLGSALVDQKDCTVDGVDISKNALAQAKSRGYRKTYQTDLNDPACLSGLKKYDFIICADVLEHLLDPEEFLRNLKGHLKPGGKIIISIPNIGFAWYRLTHLLGRWEYEEKGVMDRTHIYFFTKETAERMFKRAGYKIDLFQSYNEVRPALEFLKLLGRIRPSAFSIQLVFVISNSKK